MFHFFIRSFPQMYPVNISKCYEIKCFGGKCLVPQSSPRMWHNVGSTFKSSFTGLQIFPATCKPQPTLPEQVDVEPWLGSVQSLHEQLNTRVTTNHRRSLLENFETLQYNPILHSQLSTRPSLYMSLIREVHFIISTPSWTRAPQQLVNLVWGIQAIHVLDVPVLLCLSFCLTGHGKYQPGPCCP